MRELLRVYHQIRALHIQGAHRIAIAGVRALRFAQNPRDVQKLLSARPTEPCLYNALISARRFGSEQAIQHLYVAHNILANNARFLFSKHRSVFTHCHSSAVIDVLTLFKPKVRHVFCTETRPLYQGHRTAQDLSKVHIPHTLGVDSALPTLLSSADLVLLGCDAITSHFVYNKVGSDLVCDAARHKKIPVYICTDSWKVDFRHARASVDERLTAEVWNHPLRGTKIINPAFVAIDPSLITGIISELGVHSPQQFLVEVKKAYPWIV